MIERVSMVDQVAARRSLRLPAAQLASQLHRAALLITLTFALLCSCATPRATGEAEDDLRLELIEWARLAQNAHNFQSWRVELDAERQDRFMLYIDESRLLPATDPRARQVTISAGTFLAVVDARAVQLGYQVQIELFPEGEYTRTTIGELPVAEVIAVPTYSAVSRYAAAAEPDAITSPTVKYRYRPAELDEATVREIEALGGDGIRITVITDPGEVEWLNELSVEAFTIEMQTEATMSESYNNTRMTRRQRKLDPYGLAYTANFPRRSLWLVQAVSAIFPQRPERWAQTGINLFTAALEEVTTYVMLTTNDNSRTTQVRAGMALQTAWMELHSAGHLALANSQALQEYSEMRELYDAIHSRYASGGGTIQMLLAVARPKGGAHQASPRFAVQDLLSGSEAGDRE